MYQKTKASIKANVLCFGTAKQQRCGVTGRFLRSGNELRQWFRSVKYTFTSSLQKKASKGAFRQFGGNTDIGHIWGKMQLRPQRVTWDVCWGSIFNFVHNGGSGTGCVWNCSASGVSRQFLVSVLVPEDVRMLPTAPSILFACVHQVMLDSLQSTFVRIWLVWHEQSLV